MPYAVKEIHYTIQGEGANAGRVAVFCRFAGCNLWTGREADRAEAVCQFCDTDFVGVDGPAGGHFESADELTTAIRSCLPSGTNPKGCLIVFTGGEPLLQLDEALILTVKQFGFEVAVETNGTLPAPPGIDWLCVSPKAGAPLVLPGGNELKLVFPQAGIDPANYLGLFFDNFFLQPMDGPDEVRNRELTVRYCLAHPQWRLSLQIHKILGIP